MWKKTFNISFITLITLFVVGCSSDVKEKDLKMSEENRTFEVGPVVVNTVGVSGMNNIEVLKNGKVLNFASCIVDRALGKRLAFRRFTILGGEKTLTKRTDENGCLYWSEAISVSDYESMGFQSLERTIRGEEPYYGILKLEFAFQPLADGSNAIVDLRHAQLPSSKQSKALRNSSPQFLLDEIKVVPAISAQTQEMLKTPYREIAVTVKVRLLEFQTRTGITKHNFKIVLSDTPNVKDWNSVPTLSYAMNTNGDFMTSAVIRYKRFAGEHYFRKYIVVKSMEEPFDETPVFREVYINPWQWWEGFFFQDSKEGVMSEAELSPPVRPRLLVRETWLSYTGNVEDSYRLDKHLNFTFVKNYQIKFRPIIDRLRLAVPKEDFLYEKVTIAELKARLTLIRPKDGSVDLEDLTKRGRPALADYEYVTGTEVIVPVRAALATENFDLTFDFTDIAFMVTRSLLLIEISPSDPDWEIDPALAVITMKAGEFWVTEGALVNTVITENGHLPSGWIDEVRAGGSIMPITKDEMPEEFLPKTKLRTGLADPLQSYVDHQMESNPNMKVLDQRDASDYPMFEKLRTNSSLFKGLYNYASNNLIMDSDIDMKEYTENQYVKRNYVEFMNQVCDLFYPESLKPSTMVYNYPSYGYNPADYENADCKKTMSPGDFLNITPITFMTGEPLFKTRDGEGNIIHHVRKVSTGRDKFGINLNLKKGYGSGESRARSRGFSFSLSSLLNLVPALGTAASKLGLSAGYSYSDSRSVSDTEATDVGVGSSYNLMSDHLQLAFTAPSRSCLLVEKRRDKIRSINDDPETLNTYMVCYANENSMQYFKEDWYFLNPGNTDLSHFVDFNGIQNRNMIYPIRGVHNFIGFRDLITSNLSYFLHTNQELDQPLVRLALQSLFNISPNGIPAFTDMHYPGLIIGNILE